MLRPPPALVALWDRRLRESGFRDIETRGGRLLGTDVQHRADAAASWRDREAIFEYFTRAEHLIGEPQFAHLSPFRRAIWRLHAEGQSNREIARELGISVKAVRCAVIAGRCLAGLPVVASATARLGGARRAVPPSCEWRVSGC